MKHNINVLGAEIKTKPDFPDLPDVRLFAISPNGSLQYIRVVDQKSHTFIIAPDGETGLYYFSWN